MKYIVWALVAVVAFAVLVLILFNEELIFWRTFSYMAGKIAGESGIHPRLAEVLAVAYALVVALSFTISFDPAKRKRSLIVIAALTALYSGFMYAMTRDDAWQGGKPIKFFEEQADGTFRETHRPRNPRTNQPNISITRENQRWADGRPAQRVQITKETHFFGSAELPLVYYARRGRELDFFDRPGAHPQTRQRLQPVTPEIVDEVMLVLNAGTSGSSSVLEVRPPKRVAILPDMEFFDANGEPLYWFDPDYEEWQLFDAEGAHPRTGATMVKLDRSYAALLRHAIREELKRDPENLRGRGLTALRNYSRELTARTRGGS